ncbi:MAG: hypothetical protein H0U74_15380 [Bradymonadaceae bacterium]|nr:hypothetical protein [Lujinxingiaceae bacterium]
MKRLIVLSTLLAVIGLPHVTSAADRKPKELISGVDVQLGGHMLQSDKQGIPQGESIHGVDLGVQIAYYSHQSMLRNWSGVDLALRMGKIGESVFILMRTAVPWTVLDTDHLALAMGIGAELALMTNDGYASALLCMRLGLGLGPLELRTEFDLHVGRGYRMRALAPLVGGLGVGAELSKIEANKSTFDQQTLLLFYRFGR